MKTHELLGTIAITCVMASAVACNRQPTETDARQAADDIKAGASRAGDQLKVVASRASDQLADAWITTKIQSQYFADDDIKARYINVDTKDGVVTLSGRVENQRAHDQAVETAKNTDSVREVHDQLTIGPATKALDGPQRMDAASITTKIQAKFFADPGIKMRDISVSTNSGMVTIWGRVDSEQERRRAVEIAKNTDGVTGVQDHLAVAPASGAVATTGAPAGGEAPLGQVDDSRITNTIQSRFYLDDLVKGRRITVDSRQGVVTLRGDVASEYERAQALSLARTTDGVTRVEDNLSVVALPASRASDSAGDPTTKGAAATSASGTAAPVTGRPPVKK